MEQKIPEEAEKLFFKLADGIHEGTVVKKGDIIGWFSFNLNTLHKRLIAPVAGKVANVKEKFDLSGKKV